MAESGTESALISWSVPQCPFSIEYSARVVDDIRLAVTDAFFSLPRGGAEIGGILLGTFDGGRLAILDYAPLECEHAFGPSFQISLNDETRLEELLATAPRSFPGLKTVGWYHSHTRSGIQISDTDLEIHNLFFPEPWHVAMVMKPHTFEPTRMGFFFREPDGGMHVSASFKEVEVTARPMRQVPSGPPPPEPTRPSAPHRERARRMSSLVDLEITVEPVAAETVAPKPAPVAIETAPANPAPVVIQPPPKLAPVPQAPERPATPAAVPAEPGKPEAVPGAEPAVPRFLTEQAPPSTRWRSIAVRVLGCALALGAIAAAFQTREAWMPKFVTAVRPAPPPAPPPSLGLRAADRDGQLEVSWDRESLPLRQAVDGVLEIGDGGPLPKAIPLDLAHLQSGTFTYGRQSEKVDVRLILRAADGKQSMQVASFLGALPDRKPQVESEEARRQRDELAAQAEKLKLDMDSQAAKTKKLEKELKTVRDEMRQQQRKRLLNQAGK